MEFWPQIKMIAFGVLSLRPHEMWAITLTELIEMADAYGKETVRRMESEYHRTAWLSANLMNTMGTLKRPVTVDMLLGREKDDSEIQTSEDRKQAFQELLEKFNGEAGRG
ncbi:phage tail assembly chaperone [Heliophilum fasciatum]|uniref:Tail assembly chaperone n=1 Tax=Heliophilum fasciatum TaxID=35700 RepID=A0A4R2RCX7_9FIRM|nr:phage tail assembly chaperone [Heliophilum fasciatum]MCW2279110.1 hypothetical protein [Heliophilum fasciatum]TCP61262.1 tail assembly chaperone [Heliophilum fasciatum]